MKQSESLPEILFASSDAQVSRQLGKWVQEGRIRKLSGRLYTSNMQDAAEVIVQRNLFYILGQLYEGAVLSYRSALELRPTDLGNLYLTYTYTDTVDLPGLRLKLVKGAAALPTDNVLQGALYLASLERACLENLRPSRKGKDGERRSLEAAVIEDRLVDILRIEGETGLNAFRDRARTIATDLGWQRAFEQLNKRVSALLSTKPSQLLRSPQAVATALGMPYDSYRIDLFGRLFADLEARPLAWRKEQAADYAAFENFAFFEAYFSNYIEGTVFEVEEARAIVFDGRVIANRMGDSHDVRGTYQLVSNTFELRNVPTTYEEWLDLLLKRHAVIMGGRPDKGPGQWKQQANRAGNTLFVAPALVRGTLKQAFEPYRALSHPLARAIFMMFVVSEVHPFEDGNGRLARVMMNAELVAANLTKIIIPDSKKLGGIVSISI